MRFRIMVFVCFALIFVTVIFLFVFLKFPQEETLTPKGVTNLIVLHSFNKGVHSYTGIIKTPTPCYQIFGQAIVKESYPEKVDIYLETRDTDTVSSICAQVISEKRFRVDFEASEEASINGYLNGTPVLFEISEPSSDLNK